MEVESGLLKGPKRSSLLTVGFELAPFWLVAQSFNQWVSQSHSCSDQRHKSWPVTPDSWTLGYLKQNTVDYSSSLLSLVIGLSHVSSRDNWRVPYSTVPVLLDWLLKVCVCVCPSYMCGSLTSLLWGRRLRFSFRLVMCSVSAEMAATTRQDAGKITSEQAWEMRCSGLGCACVCARVCLRVWFCKFLWLESGVFYLNQALRFLWSLLLSIEINSQCLFTFSSGWIYIVWWMSDTAESVKSPWRNWNVSGCNNSGVGVRIRVGVSVWMLLIMHS